MMHHGHDHLALQQSSDDEAGHQPVVSFSRMSRKDTSGRNSEQYGVSSGDMSLMERVITEYAAGDSLGVFRQV